MAIQNALGNLSGKRDSSLSYEMHALRLNDRLYTLLMGSVLGSESVQH